MKLNAEKVVPLVSAACLIGLLVFVYGVAVGRYQVWPWGLIEQAQQVFDSYRKYGRFVPVANLYTRAAAEAPRENFYVHRPEAVADGMYVMMGWNDQVSDFSAWLYSSSGELLHTWRWDYDQLDPDGPINGSAMPHGFTVMPDASIILNFDKGDVMARIDACGKPRWQSAGIYHHAIDVAEDGSAWTWRGSDNATWGPFNYLVQFDPEDGSLLREIGLIEDVIRPSKERALIFSFRADHPFDASDGNNDYMSKHDFFHPNDVEVLDQSMAGQFPEFLAGDLLLSFRNIDLVMVIDPDTLEVRWHGRAPWLRQHDPDFRSDGKISIYSNNSSISGSSIRRSEILVVDPRTGVVENELADGELRFYSAAMGKHQYLPSGNILITVPAEGRVIEVDAQGNKVLELNNRVKGLDGFNAHVENGIWLAPDFLHRIPTCETIVD